MEIEFQNKPSPELINRYCKKLEEFLSAHNLSVHIEVWDSPSELYESINSRFNKVIHLWIGKVVVKSAKLGELEVDLIDSGIEENITDGKIWSNAWYIQEQIYNHFKLDRGHPDDGEPYWKLWTHHPAKKPKKYCPECLKRHMPEPVKVEMKLEKTEDFPDRYVCPECGYEELA